VAALPAGRRLLRARVAPTINQVLPQLLQIAQHPRKLTEGIGGTLLLSAAYIGCLAVCVRALGGSLPIASVAVVYLTASAAGSLVPTPGGLGAIEALMSAGLTAAVYRTVTRLPLDYSGPLVPTPFGDYPLDLWRQVFRGTLLLAVLIAVAAAITARLPAARRPPASWRSLNGKRVVPPGRAEKNRRMPDRGKLHQDHLDGLDPARRAEQWRLRHAAPSRYRRQRTGLTSFRIWKHARVVFPGRPAEWPGLAGRCPVRRRTRRPAPGPAGRAWPGCGRCGS